MKLGAQAGNLAADRVAMERALADRLVQRAYRLAQSGLRLLGILAFDRLGGNFDCGAHTGFDSAIILTPLFILPAALLC